MSRPSVIRVGAWTLDPTTRILSRRDVRHRLEPKMVDVLTVLVEHRGEVVDREVIERTVWSGAAVGGDLLNRTIWKLRKVLEDDPSSPRYIETIPRKGYRLIAPLECGGEPTVLTGSRRGAPLVAVGLGGLAVVAVSIWAASSMSTAPSEPEGLMVASPLTTTPGYEESPSVSPDGKWVAYQRYATSAVDPSWDVMVMEIDSRHMTPLASQPRTHEYSPAWARAGDSVAYIQAGQGCRVVLQHLAGEPVEIAECAPDQWHELAWLPSGDLVLSSSAPGQTLGLVRVRRPAGRHERLTTPPMGFDGDRLPRVSPDGRRLAFVRQRTEGVADIHVVDLAGGGPDSDARRITFDARRVDGLAWNSGGDFLLFTSRRGGSTGVWRVDPDGGPPTPVALRGRNAGHLSVGPGVTVYREYYGDSDIWVFDPATGRTEPWHGSPGSEWGAAVSPDGRMVAFVSDRTGGDEIWILPVAGGEPTRLTRLDGAEVDPPRWSRDGSRIVFASALHGSYDIFTVSVDDASLVRVTDGPEDERSPSWWKEGIVYSANRTGARELWLVDLRDGSTRRLSRGGGRGARPAADGRALLYSRPAEPGIWRLSPDGGEPERLRADVQPGDWANWAPDGSSLLYLRSAVGTRSELVRLETSSDAETLLTTLPREAHPRGGVSVLPDGRILLGVIVRSESDLWVAR